MVTSMVDITVFLHLIHSLEKRRLQSLLLKLKVAAVEEELRLHP